MPRKPLAASLLLAVVLLAASACSSDSSTPTPGDGSSPGTTGPTGTGKLHKESGKGTIKNVFAKTPAGAKLSLYAASPGHEIMQQTYDADTKTWSPPTSVFKDPTRFCHSIRLKGKGPVLAATVACSISAQDVNGTQSSFVLVSTDGKTWKRADLSGASGKPSISPNGKFVSWSSPEKFLLWSSTGSFVPASYTQSSSAPTVGVTQDDGTVLLIKAMETKNKTCTISFQSISAKAPAPKTINSTLPQPDHPRCVIRSAKMQAADVIANFETTSTTKDKDGKKVTKTTTFAYAFHKLGDGKWIIKS
ncbi:MAG: sialidase family protein [Nocardioidaceae bacterium]